MKKKQARGTTWWYLVNFLLTLVFLFPFYWAFISSMKPRAEIIIYPPTFFPRHISLENYMRLFAAGGGKFVLFIKNTFLTAVPSAFSVCIISVFAGYALSCLRFRGINLVFLAVLLIMMIPFQALLVPLYDLVYRMGILDTYLALILIYSTFYMPFGIFMMRNSFDTIPNALREAALIDGASELRVLCKVYLPLTWPGIATTAIYVFLHAWNDFLINLTFASSEKSMTIQVGLMNFATSRFYADWGMINAGSTVAMLPVLVLFIFLQRYFIKGMLSGAVK